MGLIDCEFVYSASLMARLSALQSAAGVPPVEILKQVSVITREARLCLRPYNRADLKTELIIEPVEAPLWFRECHVRLELIALQKPDLVLICLLSEAPVDDCFWVDRVLNAVSLKMAADDDMAMG